MRKLLYVGLGLVVLPLLALSASTAPVGYSLAYWMHKHGEKPVRSELENRGRCEKIGSKLGRRGCPSSGCVIIDNEFPPAIDNMNSFLTKLRLVTAFALAGCALAGAALGWAHFPIDVHVPGAILGALAGILMVRDGRLEASGESAAPTHGRSSRAGL